MFFSADDDDQDFLSPGGSVQCQVYLKSYNLLQFQILGGGYLHAHLLNSVHGVDCYQHA